MAKRRNVLFRLCLCFCFCFIFRSLGAFPNYWEGEIVAVADKVNGLGGVSFGFITDFHNKSNNGHSPALLQRIMEFCDITHYVNGGDMATDGALYTEQMTIEDLADADSKFVEISHKCLKVEGNHDSAYSTLGEGSYYHQNLTPDRIRQVYFKTQVENTGIFFSATGNYYYTDDAENQIRYIILNSQDKGYGERDDGGAVDNKMWNFRFREDQISWLKYWALVLPNNDWSVVIASHAAPGENSQTGSDYPIENYQEVIDVLNVFVEDGGTVICWLAGHSHVDRQFKLGDINIILTLNDNPGREPESPEKIAGTTTEQAFDIFTVDKEKRVVHITRVGAGEDREFKY